MANLTLTLDDDLLLRARRRALENGTSVNALVRDYLQAFAGDEAVISARAALVSIAMQTSGSSGPGGRSWTRDELHEP